MTLTIDLAPEEEARLRQRAAQQGQPTETVAAALLKQLLQTDPVQTGAMSAASNAMSAASDKNIAPDETTEMTDAEFHAYWGPYIGVIHSGGANMSENCGEKFAEGMAEKHRQGHL